MRSFFPSFAAAGTLLLTHMFACQLSQAQSARSNPGLGAVAQQENAMWDAIRSAKWDDVAAYLTTDYVFVGEQIEDREHALADMKMCKISDYKLHDAQNRTLAPGTVLVTYVATVSSICGGHSFTGDVNCSSIWQDSNGRWSGVAHTEFYVPKPS